MPYGVKRGVKAPGEFNTADIAGLALAGAAGIVAALVTDYNQKGEASAIYTINSWAVALGRILQFPGDVPLWAVALTIVGVGAGSIFYFQPITRQGAFAQGFGLLAVVMTAVPADLADSLLTVTGAGANEDLPGLSAPSASEASFDAAAVTLEPAVIRGNHAGSEDPSLTRVQDNQAAVYDVRLRINFPNGLPDDVETMLRRGTLRGRLHNENTKETYNLFRSAGGVIQRQGNTLTVVAGVPARTRSATLWVRIECDKYKIEVQSNSATIGSPLNWNVTMQSSNVPLVVQRLNTSYWF